MTQRFEYMTLRPRNMSEIDLELTRWPILGWRFVSLTDVYGNYLLILERPMQ